MNKVRLTHIDGKNTVLENYRHDLSSWFKNREDIVKAEFLEINGKVKDMYDIFFGCHNLSEFISHVDLSNVNLEGAFFGCNKLTLSDDGRLPLQQPFTITENPLHIQVGGSHYLDMKLSPLEYILANDLGFVEGCIIKYISRYKNKHGLEDLKKVKHYVEILIQQEEDKC